MYLAIVAMFIVLVIHNVLQHNRMANLERRLSTLENNQAKGTPTFSSRSLR